MHIYRYRPFPGAMPYLGAVLSGVAIYCAVLHMQFVLAWVCQVPLFYCLDRSSTDGSIGSGSGGSGRSFKTGSAHRPRAAALGFVTGLTLSVCSFYWMIPGAAKFTGASVWYGVGVFLACTLWFSGYWALVLYVYGLLSSRRVGPGAAAEPVPPGAAVQTRRRNRRLALLAASLFTCAEAGLEALTKGMPWFQFHFGNALAQNLYAIQWTSYTGVYGLSFVVVLVNYAIAQALRERRWIKLIYPITGILLLLALGYGMLVRYERKTLFTKRNISISILSENIPTSLQWDNLSGDSLVGRLLYLAGQASIARPNINLWSESAIPWTYSPADDLVKEIDRLADSAGSTQILGMNTAFGQGEVFNSAYCIKPGGVVAGRYDKQVLLQAIEQRWNGWLIPFFSSNGYSVHAAESSAPLKTPYGLAGIMICNESTLASVARYQVLNGADFLLNLSNDGWFSDTYLAPLHFYNARLRAVETRRDIAINSNNGISGLIDASGRIKQMKRDDAPFLLNGIIHPRQGYTLGIQYPYLPLWICGAIIVWSIASILYTLKRHRL